MDMISLTKANEALGIAKFAHVTSLNFAPNVLGEYHATCGNTTGTLGTYFAAVNSGTITRKTSGRYYGRYYIEVAAAAAENSGVVTGNIAVSPETTYTFYTLVRGVGNFKNIITEKNSGGSVIVTNTGTTTVLNGYEVIRTTITTNSETASIVLWWVTQDGKAMNFDIISNVLKAASF